MTLSAFNSRVVVRLCAIVLVGTALVACSTGANAPWADLDQLGRLDAKAPRLTAGDQLRIEVFGENDLSGTFAVSGAGKISFPLIGQVRAAGLTAEQLRRKLHAKLSNGYLKNPKIAVDVTTFRPILVHGEVRTGGEIKYRSGLTFTDAIATAGGYTYRADESYVLLVRRGQSRPVRVAMPNAAAVLPGDNIRIPERLF